MEINENEEQQQQPLGDLGQCIGLVQVDGTGKAKFGMDLKYVSQEDGHAMHDLANSLSRPPYTEPRWNPTSSIHRIRFNRHFRCGN